MDGVRPSPYVPTIAAVKSALTSPITKIALKVFFSAWLASSFFCCIALRATAGANLFVAGMITGGTICSLAWTYFELCLAKQTVMPEGHEATQPVARAEAITIPEGHERAVLRARPTDNNKGLAAVCKYNERLLSLYQNKLKGHLQAIAIAIAIDPSPELLSLTARTYSNVGLCMNHFQATKKGLEALQKAQKIWEKVFRDNPNHEYLRKNCTDLGTALFSLEQYNDALSFYQQALDKAQESLEENNQAIASSHFMIGSTLSALGRHNEALAPYQRALGIYQQTLNNEHAFVKTTLTRIGECRALALAEQ